MTVDEYYLAAETGIFRSDEKLELIWGDVIELSRQLSRHASGTLLVAQALGNAFPDAVIRQHSPLRLDEFNEPEPDMLVARGPDAAYDRRHPTAADTLLVLEVADSSLRKDRTLKAALYASFGIAEYWILDLNANRLEVYRDPVAGEEGKGSYSTVRTLGVEDSIAPLQANGHKVAFRSMLPR
jgi:Uma2 family endonuclease